MRKLRIVLFVATLQVPRHRAIFDSKLTACPLSVPFFLNKKAPDNARSLVRLIL